MIYPGRRSLLRRISYQIQIIVTLLFAFLPSIASAQNEINEGRAAANHGRYLEAFAIWQPLARGGDAQAQFLLGLLYARGDGVAKDYFEARRLFEASSEQGFAPAMLKLGVMYRYGDGGPLNAKRARELLRAAQEKGQLEAAHYLRDLGEEPESQEEVKLLEQDPRTTSSVRSLLPAETHQQPVRPDDRSESKWMPVALKLILAYLAVVFLLSAIGRVVMYDDSADFGLTIIGVGFFCIGITAFNHSTGIDQIILGVVSFSGAFYFLLKSLTKGTKANSKPIAIVLFPAKCVFAFLAPLIIIGLMMLVAGGRQKNSRRTSVTVGEMLSVAALVGSINWCLVNGERVRNRRNGDDEINDEEVKFFEDEVNDGYTGSGSAGYIYVLSNPAFSEHLYKVGMTRRDPRIRAEEMSRATGVPLRYEVKCSCKVTDVVTAERAVHAALDPYRINTQREHFRVEFSLLQEILSETVKQFTARDTRQEKPKEEKKEETKHRTPYEVLGLSSSASQAEIRAQYLNLAKKYHPDRVQHLGDEFRSLAHTKMVEIQRAYDTLTPGPECRA